MHFFLAKQMELLVTSGRDVQDTREWDSQRKQRRKVQAAGKANRTDGRRNETQSKKRKIICT